MKTLQFKTAYQQWTTTIVPLIVDTNSVDIEAILNELIAHYKSIKIEGTQAGPESDKLLCEAGIEDKRTEQVRFYFSGKRQIQLTEKDRLTSFGFLIYYNSELLTTKETLLEVCQSMESTEEWKKSIINSASFKEILGKEFIQIELTVERPAANTAH